MSKYTGIQKEETLKGLIFKDFFDGKKFGYEPNIDNIDFVVTDAKTRGDLFAEEGSGASVHYLWAEAKKGVQDVGSMFTQLILTCKKTYDKADYSAPPFIGCFDTEKIAFVPFYCFLPIFKENDINWNATPSNHDAPDFIKARSKITNLILDSLVVFQFDTDEKEIKEFVINNFVVGASSIKSPITKENFVQVFIKWIKEVKPFINIAKDEWAELKERGILDCDFYRADVMSRDGTTITEKLKIVLGSDTYKFQEYMNGRLFSTDIDFTDGGVAYKRFWNKYGRPPAEEYQQYIIDRRDLLVPQNIREMKGTFFTPAIWADKSKEYLARVFGDNWQEEYYVWDCAAGTGNLLAGLSNEYNVWASDIEQGNVETMQALIDIDDNLNLLSGHVFQFDFLNDSFDKLPVELKKIIDDPEKRKKLIIYINPPYAETMSKTETDKTGLNQTMINTRYKLTMGNCANRELFVQFLTRVYFEIPDCKIGVFSKLKTLNSPNFVDFRKYFSAKLEKIFLCPASTFDNVKGKFPIGFQIWNIEVKEHFTSINAEVFNEDGSLYGKKSICSYDDVKFINEWIISTRNQPNEKQIGFIYCNGNDFQHTNYVSLVNDKKQFPAPRGTWVTDKNLIEVSIYYSVRHGIEPTWLNDRDQFLYPNDGWKTDTEFQNDCLVNILFNNNIQSQHGTNHWIPFTEKEVGAKEKFESNFMSNFLKDKTLSVEAQSVYDVGLALWKYYHAKTKNNNSASVNASFYDIREYFQGRNDKGTMNSKSTDETYTQLLGALRDALKTLTQKIQPKVYEYGFLRE